ncbi:hypothetical protein [Dawidia soli]|uniref:Uncharacterized protein n=1 Tax=Dawidia soli TaxID=2782352 RepID=A0AAP2GG03_9BACT|nr:hypothetical protein [Dawidia soli]MBT1685611.1 hypothetical protein [Dawidia soli]
MGQWNTLHTFDEKLYQTRTRRLLEDEHALWPYYQMYKSISLPGTCRFTPADFVRYAAEFQQQIADLFVVGRVKDDNARLPLSAQDEYAFIDLFTFLIFQTSARFDPYFRLGYRAFANAVEVRNRESLSSQILSNLLDSYNEFNRDGSGIRKILTAVDVRIFMLDLDNLTAKPAEGAAEYVDEFKQYITYLAARDLGILSGLDLLPQKLMHTDAALPDLRDLTIESLRYD